MKSPYFQAVFHSLSDLCRFQETLRGFPFPLSPPHAWFPPSQFHPVESRSIQLLAFLFHFLDLCSSQSSGRTGAQFHHSSIIRRKYN